MPRQRERPSARRSHGAAGSGEAAVRPAYANPFSPRIETTPPQPTLGCGARRSGAA
jgi:hypothetical protein